MSHVRSAVLLLLATLVPCLVAAEGDANCPAFDFATDDVSLLQHKAEVSALSEKTPELADLELLQVLSLESTAAQAQAQVVDPSNYSQFAYNNELPKDHDVLRSAAKQAAAAACESADRLLFIGILSAPDNAERRQVSRELFLNDFRQAGFDDCVRIRFIIGHAEFVSAHQGQVGTDEQMDRERELEEESRQYDDVMRVMVPESYKSLPDKVMAFVSTSVIEGYAFVAKVDDDTIPDLTVMLPMITRADPESFLYAGRFLWDKQYYPFQAGADGSFAPYFSGPTYLLSSGLARQIAVEDIQKTAEFVSYGSKSEDMDMGKWVKLAEQISGKKVEWQRGHLSYNLCAGPQGCSKAGYTKS